MSSICAAPDTQMTKPGFADDTKTAAQLPLAVVLHVLALRAIWSHSEALPGAYQWIPR